MTNLQTVGKTSIFETSISCVCIFSLIISILFSNTLLSIITLVLSLLFCFAWPRLLVLEHPISIFIITAFMSTCAIVLQTFFTLLGNLTYQIYIFTLCFIVCVIDELFISKNKEPMSSLAYSFLGSLIAVSSVGWISLNQLSQSAKLYTIYSLLILFSCCFLPIFEKFLLNKLSYQQFNYARFSISASLGIFGSLISYFSIYATVGTILSWKLCLIISNIIFISFVVKTVLFSDIYIKKSILAKAIFPILFSGILVYIALNLFIR
ncbi:MAG: hypothetical protein LBT85_03165 [Bifidobacteriaceae bacterium]|jgi:hypothetical protein|nr:hypothetical protein [Bifidobacteriaceae bacterium]